MRALATALLLTGCSYTVLPGAPPQGTGALPLRYERKIFFFGVDKDVQADRIFAARGAVLAQVSDPVRGLFASQDGGANWSIVPFPVPLLEVLPAGDLLYARGAYTAWRSADGGKSWSLALTGRAEVASFSRSGEGVLIAAGGRVYASADGGRGLRPLAIQGAPAPQFRSVAATGQTLLASVRGTPAKDLLASAREIVDGHTGETDAVLDAKAGVTFGSSTIYVSHDGGSLWTKSTLGLDAWLVAEGGAIYAVAADPLLEVATLSRANPALAHALSLRLHDQRVDADDVRTALAWPGRDALVKGALPLVFRSSDFGETWTRAAEVPAAVWADVVRQRAVYPVEAEIDQTPRMQMAQPRRPGQRPEPAAPRPVSPRVPDEVLLSFLDPLRLLARQNHGALFGFARSGSEVWAYVPTRATWEALRAAVVAGTSAEGEIWLGAVRPVAGAQAELLRSVDGGATFAEVPGLGRAWPTSIAALPGAAYLTLRGQGAMRVVP